MRNVYNSKRQEATGHRRTGQEVYQVQRSSKMNNAQLREFLELIAKLIESRQADTKEAAEIVRAAKPKA